MASSRFSPSSSSSVTASEKIREMKVGVMQNMLVELWFVVCISCFGEVMSGEAEGMSVQMKCVNTACLCGFLFVHIVM